MYNYQAIKTKKREFKIPKAGKGGKDLVVVLESGTDVASCLVNKQSSSGCVADPSAVIQYFHGALETECPAGTECYASGLVQASAGTSTGALQFDGEFCVGVKVEADFGKMGAALEAAIGAEGCLGGTVKRPSKGCCKNGQYALYFKARFSVYGYVKVFGLGVEIKGGLYITYGPLAKCAAPRERKIKTRFKV